MNSVKKEIDLKQKDYIIHKYTELLGSVSKDLGGLFTFVLFFGIFYLHKNFDISFWLFALSCVPCVIYIYLLAYYIPKNAIEEYKNSNYNKISIVLTIDKENLIVKRADKPESTIKLTQLMSFWETGKYIRFFITRQNLLILPKRQLNTDELAFVHNVAKTLPSKQKRNPYRVKFKNFVISAFSVIFITFCIAMIVLSFTLKK